MSETTLPLTPEQQKSLAELRERFPDITEPQPLLMGDGCVMVHAAGMWIGIEKDGYTHT